MVDTQNHTGYAQVVEELQGATVTKQFTFGHDLISQRIGANISYYQYDGHGSVRQLTNTAGAITDTYTYDAFGNLINRTGTTPNDYLYAGEQFDANLGFYYLRARYMNPSSGRFHSQDSYEGNQFEPASLHKYSYAHNNPVNMVDPTGKYISHAAITVGIVVAAIAVLSIGTILYNLRNYGDLPINVTTQPVVLRNSNWRGNSGIPVEYVLAEAARTWWEIARIRFTWNSIIEDAEAENLLDLNPPIENFQIPDWGKHMTIFNRSLSVDGVAGSSSDGQKAAAFIAWNHSYFLNPGRSLAHEWGHTLGLKEHVTGTLMNEFSAFTTPIVTPSQKQKARETASNASYFRR